MQEQDRKVLKGKKSSIDKAKIIHKQNTIGNHIVVSGGIDREVVKSTVNKNL
jgi:hypothetical protein